MRLKELKGPSMEMNVYPSEYHFLIGHHYLHFEYESMPVRESKVVVNNDALGCMKIDRDNLMLNVFGEPKGKNEIAIANTEKARCVDSDKVIIPVKVYSAISTPKSLRIYIFKNTDREEYFVEALIGGSWHSKRFDGKPFHYRIGCLEEEDMVRYVKDKIKSFRRCYNLPKINIEIRCLEEILRRNTTEEERLKRRLSGLLD